MKRIILIIFTALCVLNTLQAQELKQPVNIQSPNASSLGKYGDVPVSFFTGTPNISVPIHSLNVKGIELNIALNYDASGVRVDQHPGWVGQNWNLSAGGLITRTVMGGADELTYNNTNISTPYPNLGFFYHFNELNDINTSSTTQLKNIAYNNGTKSYDYQPDIFTFNFMGMTGQFFMDNDGKWKVSSENNIMVVYENYLVPTIFENLPGTSNYKNHQAIGGFKIIDGNGTTYVFGYNSNAIEYSIGFFNQIGTDQWKANSWYLTKVIDKFGSEIYRFEYERSSFIAHFYRGDTNKIWDLDGNGGLFNPAPNCVSNSGLPSEDFNINGNLISPVYLKSIFTPLSNFASISFEMSNTTELKYNSQQMQARYGVLVQWLASIPLNIYPIYYLQENNEFIDPSLATTYMENLHWKKLDCIKVWGDLNKKIQIQYNNSATERLNLTRLDIISGDWPYNQTTYQKHSYSFDYNQFSSLPGYLTKVNDHWGYNKGTPYTINTNSFSTYYNQRQPNASYLTIGMLSKITYPTGGYTQFDFEPNSYSKIVSDDRSGFLTESGIAGGARIIKITNFDGIINNETTFKYVSNYYGNHSSTTSSGILSSKPKYYWPDWRTYCDGGEYSQSVFSVNSIVPLANYFGTHIGYSEVAEIRNDGSYTLHKFSNFDTSTDYKDNQPVCSFNSTVSPYSSYSDRSLMRGKILNRAIYNSNNSLVKEIIYSYRSDQNMYSNYILASNSTEFNACPATASPVDVGNAYKIYFFDYDYIQEETKDYLLGGAVSQKIIYTKEDSQLTNATGSSNIRLLKSIKNELSDKNIILNHYYPTDLSSETNMQSLINNFRIGEPIKTISFSLVGASSNPIGVNKTTYKTSNNTVVKDKEYSSTTDESKLEQTMSYDVYSNDGTLQQYTTRKGIPVALLWDSKMNYLRANIENALFSDVSSLTGGAEYNDSKLLWSNINSSVPNSLIKTYSYKPFVGMSSQTDQMGVTTYYYYDLFGRLSEVKNDDMKLLKKYNYRYVSN
jgi:hypothetical protein